MKQMQSPLWSDGSTEARLTGTWRSATPQYQNMPSPCLGACPVDGEIAKWLSQVSKQDHYGGWLTLMENNPFPAIAGRICHHPCQSACNRVQYDETVGICSLERFVGDLAIEKGWVAPKPEVECSERVAVIGGGPAGLAAAYHLRRRGYQVALYEKYDQLGGLLRYGIPAYRLNKAVLDTEINRILDMGVEVHLNAEVIDTDSLKMLNNEYDAVFLATGASQSKTVPGLDYDQSFIMNSADFLSASSADKMVLPGNHLIVIGGGSAAMDVARTARRMGREVTVLSLESSDTLPAQEIEVEEARQEGVEFVCGAMLQNVSQSDDGLVLNCSKVDFRQEDTPGNFTVTPIEGEDFIITADGIIPAIGQDADLARWQGVVSGSAGIVQTDDEFQTSTPGIFAGGDIASMDRFVTEALGMGKRAAFAIADYIGNQTSSDPTVRSQETKFSAINTAYHSPENRALQVDLDVATRLQNFDEVQQGLSEKIAVIEAGRCFRCGTCILCDNCYLYCPDMAITKLEAGYVVNADYCKGCGLCVAECPTGSINMQEGA